jgi:hypothetical protein
MLSQVADLLKSSVVLAALAVVLAPGFLLNVKVLGGPQLSGGAPSLESAIIHGLLLGVVYQLVKPRLGALSALSF